jgi:hypothetical protein
VKYLYTIKIPFEEMDDIEAKKFLHRNELHKVGENYHPERKLQEVFPDKEPRKILI